MHHLPSAVVLQQGVVIPVPRSYIQQCVVSQGLSHGSCTFQRVLYSMQLSSTMRRISRQLYLTMHHLTVPRRLCSTMHYHILVPTAVDCSTTRCLSQGGCSPTMHCHIHSAVVFNASLYPSSLSTRFPWWLFFNNVLSPQFHLAIVHPTMRHLPSLIPWRLYSPTRRFILLHGGCSIAWHIYKNVLSLTTCHHILPVVLINSSLVLFPVLFPGGCFIV